MYPHPIYIDIYTDIHKPINNYLLVYMWGSKQTFPYTVQWRNCLYFDCLITELVQRKLFTNSNIRWTSYSQRTCPRIVSASTPLRFLDSSTRQQTFLSSKCVCNLSSFQYLVCQLFVVHWPLCSVATCKADGTAFRVSSSSRSAASLRLATSAASLRLATSQMP